MPPIFAIEITDGPWIDGFLPDAALGASYSVTLRARNATAPVAWAVTGGALPAGWALDPDTGEVSGDADDAGDYSVTITLSDADARSTSRTFAFRVVALPLQIAGALDDFAVGEIYSDTLAVSDGIPPYSLASYTVPAGPNVSLVTSTVGILGTPTGAGLGPGTSFPFTVSITVEDSSDPPQQVTFEQDVTITVSAVTTTLDGGALPDATAGVAYSHDADATGGTGGYAFTKQTGPSWVLVNSSTGAITGTPGGGDTGTGITVTVRATDSEGNYDDVTDTIDVAAAPYVDDFVTLADIRQSYGLNRLIDGYAGSAIRVERSSDSTQSDIGFVGDAFDESALTAFVGAGNGRVVTWYNQAGGSGAYDLVEVGSNGPTIVSAGTYLGGIEFDGVNDNMATGAMTALGTAAITVFCAAQLYETGTGATYGYIDIGPLHGSTNSWLLDYFPTVGWRSITSVGDFSSYELEQAMTGFDPTGSMHTMTFVSDRDAGSAAAKHEIYIDGGSDCAGTTANSGSVGSTTHTGDSMYLGVMNAYARFGKGLFRSLVICKNDYSVVHVDVEALL